MGITKLLGWHRTGVEDAELLPVMLFLKVGPFGKISNATHINEMEMSTPGFPWIGRLRPHLPPPLDLTTQSGPPILFFP